MDVQTNAKRLVDNDKNWFNKILQKTISVTTPDFVPSYCLSPETRLKRIGELS